MTANTAPIYSVSANISWATAALVTAVTAVTGVGATNVFTAGSNGSRVEKIRFRALGTNVATVARVFINNGSTLATATNNILWEEITLPATTLSQTTQLLNQEIYLGFALPAGYTLAVTIGTTVAAGYAVSVIGGNY